MEQQLNNRLDKLERMVNDVIVAISGTGKPTHPGIEGVLQNQGEKLDRLEKRQDVTDDTLAKYRYIIMGWTAAGSVFGGVIVTLAIKILDASQVIP